MPHIKEDWFAAFEVRPFMKKAKAEESVKNAFASLPPQAQPFLAILNQPAEFQRRTDEGVAATWRAFRAGSLTSKPRPEQASPDDKPPTDGKAGGS